MNSTAGDYWLVVCRLCEELYNLTGQFAEPNRFGKLSGDP